MGKFDSNPPASLPNRVELVEDRLRGEQRKPEFDVRRELLFDVRQSLRRFEQAELRLKFSGEANSSGPRPAYPFTKSMTLVNEGIAFGETVEERLERHGGSAEMRKSQRTRTGKLPINSAQHAEAPSAEVPPADSELPDGNRKPTAERRTRPTRAHETVVSTPDQRAPRVAKNPTKKSPSRKKARPS